MKNAHVKSFVAISALFMILAAVVPRCRADNGISSCCNACSDYWSNSGVCRCCDRCCCYCDRICQFRVVDGCTKCAWSRTWHAPNALATPLREYYVPRPPQCCWYGGCAVGHESRGATWETPADTNCRNLTTLIGPEVSPEAAIGFSPPQFERIGKIPNELDIVGPMSSPGTNGAAAPARR